MEISISSLILFHLFDFTIYTNSYLDELFYHALNKCCESYGLTLSPTITSPKYFVTVIFLYFFEVGLFHLYIESRAPFA